MMVDGRQLLCFGGSAYLGLGGAPELVEIGCAALRQFGASTHLPRHYGFSSGANQQAEAEARRFFGTEAAMYFGTGYLFGLVALTGLAHDCDVVYIDESAHYSLRKEPTRPASQSIRLRIAMCKTWRACSETRSSAVSGHSSPRTGCSRRQEPLRHCRRMRS